MRQLYLTLILALVSSCSARIYAPESNILAEKGKVKTISHHMYRLTEEGDIDLSEAVWSTVSSYDKMGRITDHELSELEGSSIWRFAYEGKNYIGSESYDSYLGEGYHEKVIFLKSSQDFDLDFIDWDGQYQYSIHSRPIGRHRTAIRLYIGRGETRYLYKYTENYKLMPVEKLYYHDNDPIDWYVRELSNYDRKNRLLETERYLRYEGEIELMEHQRFEYLTFDRKRNWTKRVMTTDRCQYIEIREIEYY